MYLSAKIFVSGWQEESEKNYESIVKALKLENLETDEAKFLEVSLAAAYWRKANAIHQWFVNQCQGGSDDCQPYPVPRMKLEELVETCKTVLAAKGTDQELQVINEMLPPASGFFFGGTDIDEWYWHSLEDTVTQVSKILNHPGAKGFEFVYQSSW